LPEKEESGKEVQLADLRLCASGPTWDEESLTAERVDKNADFVIGACADAVRVRYSPNLGYTTNREIEGWIIARLSDEVQKSHTIRNPGATLLARTIDCAAELLLLGYRRSQVQKGFRYVRQPLLLELRDAGLVWLSQFQEAPEQRTVQEATWEFRVRQGVLR